VSAPHANAPSAWRSAASPAAGGVRAPGARQGTAWAGTVRKSQRNEKAVSGGVADLMRGVSEVVKESAGRRKRVLHLPASAVAPMWVRRLRLPTRRSTRFFHSVSPAKTRGLTGFGHADPQIGIEGGVDEWGPARSGDSRHFSHGTSGGARTGRKPRGQTELSTRRRATHCFFELAARLGTVSSVPRFSRILTTTKSHCREISGIGRGADKRFVRRICG